MICMFSGLVATMATILAILDEDYTSGLALLLLSMVNFWAAFGLGGML